MQREIDFRRRVLKVYNKNRQDFPDDETYNDYLEAIEDKVFRLQSNDISKQEKEELRN